MSVLPFSDNRGWLTVTPIDVDGDGLGTYDVSVNRSGPDPGPHSATISIDSTANDLEIDVFMVKGGNLKPNAGFQYVLLLDPATNATVGVQPRKPDKGRYTFSFPSVPAGQYLLVSGSDADNDGVICDAGESCGAYPTRGLPEPIDLQADRVGLEFDAAFPSALESTGAAYLK